MPERITTVDEAVTAGGAALGGPVAGVLAHEYRVDVPEWVPYCTCGWRASKSYASDEFDDHLARVALKAAWPNLSAPLREMHFRWGQGGGNVVCGHCNDYTAPVRKQPWPCPTMQAVLATDRALGIGEHDVPHDGRPHESELDEAYAAYRSGIGEA